jgi:hypothetical protein
MKNILNLIQPIYIVFFIIIFAVGIYAGISFIRFDPQLFYLNPIPEDQIEATLLSEKVGKLMVVPTDELPTVETITDLTPLKDRPFFIKAEVGDKVLIYKKAAKAILYRPSKNIIINTLSPNYEEAIISVTSPTPTETPIPTPTPTPTPTPSPSPSESPSPTATASASVAPTTTPKASAK